MDTNLLVLLVIGTLSKSEIQNHKRTQSRYTDTDYQLLTEWVATFKKIVTTPNILTEASNLLEGYIYKNQYALQVLQNLVDVMDEICIDSGSAMSNYQKSFFKFGLSDTVIHILAEKKYLVVTDDLNFCAFLQGKGLLALNFNNLRTDFLLR